MEVTADDVRLTDAGTERLQRAAERVCAAGHSLGAGLDGATCPACGGAPVRCVERGSCRVKRRR